MFSDPDYEKPKQNQGAKPQTLKNQRKTKGQQCFSDPGHGLALSAPRSLLARPKVPRAGPQRRLGSRARSRVLAFMFPRATSEGLLLCRFFRRRRVAPGRLPASCDRI